MDQQLAHLKRIEAELAAAKAREADIVARLDEIEEVKFGKEHPILNKPIVAIPLAILVAALVAVIGQINKPGLFVWAMVFVVLLPVLIWRFMTIRGPLISFMEYDERYSYKYRNYPHNIHNHNHPNHPFNE
jgi:Flp pilus assembly protein TadB